MKCPRKLLKRTCTGVHGWYRLKWNDAHRSCNSHCVLHLVKIQVMRVDGRKGQITSQERFLKKKIVTFLKTLNSALGGRTEVFLAGSVVGGNKRKISKGGNCVG